MPRELTRGLVERPTPVPKIGAQADQADRHGGRSRQLVFLRRSASEESMGGAVRAAFLRRRLSFPTVAPPMLSSVRLMQSTLVRC